MSFYTPQSDRTVARQCLFNHSTAKIISRLGISPGFSDYDLTMACTNRLSPNVASEFKEFVSGVALSHRYRRATLSHGKPAAKRLAAHPSTLNLLPFGASPTEIAGSQELVGQKKGSMPIPRGPNSYGSMSRPFISRMMPALMRDRYQADANTTTHPTTIPAIKP